MRRQANSLAAPLAELVARLARRPPDVVVTCARGSSAHAATFAKHLIERHLGIPVAAAAPNIATIYRQPLRLRGQLLLTISQSGSSDDLVETTGAARIAGALTVAIVNDPESPLASASEIVLPMAAGPELSVAATKTFIASLAAVLRLSAQWAGDNKMLGACDRLPDRLDECGSARLERGARPTSPKQTALSLSDAARRLAIAREAALKLKETCALHAEAFSSAEFRHGPIALVSSTYPVLVFAPTDEAASGFADFVDRSAPEGRLRARRRAG